MQRGYISNPFPPETCPRPRGPPAEARALQVADRACGRVALPLDAADALLAVAAGLLAGIASGLFGVGGGIVVVPAAVYLLDQEFHTAKAASLLVMVAGSVVGAWQHHRHGSVDWRLGGTLGAVGIVGSVVAVRVAEGVPASRLEGAFGALLVLTAARLAWASGPRPRGHGRRAVLFAVALPLGLAAGALAGFFGVGGGILIVPILALLGVPIHLAVGTSLVAVVVNAAAGTAAHVDLGYGTPLLALGIPLAIGQVPGTHLGAGLAHRMPARALRLAFAAFLAVVGARLAASLA